MGSSDDARVAPELDADARAALERYERSIGRLTFCFDERPAVLHNRSLIGRLSGRPQAVEMLLWGPVMGREIAVAVECEQGRRPVGVEAVEGFAVKVVDIAADCGVLYSVSGFTEGARSCAERMRRPAIMPLSLGRPCRGRGGAGSRAAAAGAG